jgi:uncharacterized protein (TIGR04551 family)
MSALSHPVRLASLAALLVASRTAFAQDAVPPPGDDPTESSTKTEDVKPAAGGAKADSQRAETGVVTDEWFKAAKPALELHGYFRVRSELFSHFSLGRADDPRAAMWPQVPDDDDFVALDDQGNPVRRTTVLCDDPVKPKPCEANVQAGANTRFRVTPELVISDNLRIVGQVDLFDNMVLGSTPDGYVNQPGDQGGYVVRTRGGYVPIGAFAATQWAPVGGTNSVTDSIVVKRAYGEYKSPIGTFRFGRQASHWGLGIVENAGDGLDDDFGTTVDRLSFSTGLPQFDLYGTIMWDFGNEGATGALYLPCEDGTTDCGQFSQQGQRYDALQGDDLDQWGIRIYRQVNPDRARLALSRGEVVINGGFNGYYRRQGFDSRYALGDSPRDISPTLVRRGLETVSPDLWGQLLWGTLRIELEAALTWGGIENTDSQGGNNFLNPSSDDPDDDGWNIRQFGFALETEWRAVEDRLRIGFGSGFATGDDDVEGINGFGGLDPATTPLGGLDAQLTRDRTFSTFRFHPDYRVDLILWRNILQRIQAAYYFRPSVEYDFLKLDDGQRFGGGATLVWSRASEFVQAPGNDEDLGVELDGTLYYQAQGGTFSVDDKKMTGFFAKLQYGVLFPLDGLGRLPGEEARLPEDERGLDIPQILRLYLGILY